MKFSFRSGHKYSVWYAYISVIGILFFSKSFKKFTAIWHILLLNILQTRIELSSIFLRCNPYSFQLGSGNCWFTHHLDCLVIFEIVHHCLNRFSYQQNHYSDVMMSAIASQITCLTIVYLTVYSGAAQRKHQSSASLAFVRGIHRWPVNSPHKGPVTRKMLPFDDVILMLSFCRLHVLSGKIFFT